MIQNEKEKKNAISRLKNQEWLKNAVSDALALPIPSVRT